MERLGSYSITTVTKHFFCSYFVNFLRKSLSIRLLEPNQDSDKWSWSNPFDIQSVGLYNYIIQTKDKTFTRFLKTSVTLDYSTLFVVIEEERSDQVVFKVRNECPNIEILVYQTDVHPGNGILLKTGDTIPWAWVYPNKKKEISASFCVNSLVNYHSNECAFSFDKINTVSPIKIPVDKGKRVKIYATTVVEGPARVLKFFFASKMKKNEQNNISNLNLEEKNTENKINMNIEVTVKKLGLSIISSLTTNKEKKLKERKEVLYLLFKGLEFRMLDSTHMKSSQFRLKYLNFDNNTSYDTSFPVLCTPTKPDDLLKGEKNYFLDILIAQKVNPEVTFYETIQFLLNDSTLKIDGMFINAMMEVASNFQRIFNANKYKDGKGTIAQILYHNYEAAKVNIFT